MMGVTLACDHRILYGADGADLPRPRPGAARGAARPGALARVAVEHRLGSSRLRDGPARSATGCATSAPGARPAPRPWPACSPRTPPTRPRPTRLRTAGWTRSRRSGRTSASVPTRHSRSRARWSRSRATRAWSGSRSATAQPKGNEYRDLWIVRLNDAGRCFHFEEWPFWPPGQAGLGGRRGGRVTQPARACDNASVDEVLTVRCGLVPYEEARALQKRIEAARQAGRIPDVLLLLEHPPVYTKGRRTEPGELRHGRGLVPDAGDRGLRDRPRRRASPTTGPASWSATRSSP